MSQDRPLSGVESDVSTDSAQRAHTASVTDLLIEWCSGDAEALNRLMPLVYNELRRLARYHLRGRGPDQTLQPTALVHEAYLRLANQADPVVKSRVHFYAIVSHMMRCVLVDHARRHHAAKRSGNLVRVSTDRVALVPAKQNLDVLALDDALTELAAIDPQMGRIVELRFFGGLSVEDLGRLLEISPRTVARKWVMAKAWLYRQIKQGRRIGDRGKTGRN